MRRRAMSEQDAMRMLASSGFLFFQEGDHESGEMWLRVMQQKPDRYGAFRPVDLTTLEVYQDKSGNTVVDARALQSVLDAPSQLPADVVPESRLDMETGRPIIADGWALMDEDDEDDEDKPGDYADEFRRMASE